MGGVCTRDRSMALSDGWPSTRGPIAVVLNVYDMGTFGGTQLLNKLLLPFGTGAFHCGVEVYGTEWSYSEILQPEYRDYTGVFCCLPRRCEGHIYQQSIAMGKTNKSEAEVKRILQRLERDWIVSDYDLLRRNCCHFCNEFCERLHVGSVPNWVMSLAGAGASVAAGGSCCRASLCCDAKHTTVIGGNGTKDSEIVEQISALDYRSMAKPLDRGISFSEADADSEEAVAAQWNGRLL
mmetsp:Transcript_97943/g.204300  ORF Transcript_97943/g.204300 Transcript_97943/m.204300 type:complete len:237 (+) Transcript_97943:85-795(+)